MALTFNHSNTQINNQYFSHFLSSSSSVSTARFNSWSTSSTYWTYFTLHSGQRLPLDFGTSSYPPGWENQTPQNQSTALISWGRNHSNQFGTHFVYSSLSPAGWIQFLPSWFDAKEVSQAGTATWFSIIQTENGNYRGGWTGTVGTVGSGSDLEISNTNLVTGVEYTIPGGFKLNVPNLP